MRDDECTPLMKNCFFLLILFTVNRIETSQIALMTVALGATLLDARLIALNITFLQAAYYLLLGAVLLLVEQQKSTVNAWDVSTSSVLTLRFLFGDVARLSWPVLLSSFSIHGMLFGAFAGNYIDRRSWFADVTLTAAGIHFVGCLAMNEVSTTITRFFLRWT